MVKKRKNGLSKEIIIGSIVLLAIMIYSGVINLPGSSIYTTQIKSAYIADLGDICIGQTAPLPITLTNTVYEKAFWYVPTINNDFVSIDFTSASSMPGSVYVLQRAPEIRFYTPQYQIATLNYSLSAKKPGTATFTINIFRAATPSSQNDNDVNYTRTLIQSKDFSLKVSDCNKSPITSGEVDSNTILIIIVMGVVYYFVLRRKK